MHFLSPRSLLAPFLRAAVVLAGTATALSAAPVDILPDPTPPLTQRFLGPVSSVIEQGDRRACLVFSRIDIAGSAYLTPAGADVPFAEIRRNSASGLWAIFAPGAAAPDWRVVLKYPIADPELRIGSDTWPLSAAIDPAGDSVTLPGTAVAAIRAAWAAGQTVQFVARSTDTGHAVIDRLAAPGATDLGLCQDWQADPAAAPAPAPAAASGFDPFAAPMTIGLGPGALPDGRPGRNGPLGVDWGETLPGTPDPSLWTACRMTGDPAQIERHALTRTQGFVAPMGEAWISRDAAGAVRQVYVPGVFEALRSPAGWQADVSVSAFANDAFERPLFKGCLGTQRVTMAPRGDAGLLEQDPGGLVLLSASAKNGPAPIWPVFGDPLGVPRDPSDPGDPGDPPAFWPPAGPPVVWTGGGGDPNTPRDPRDPRDPGDPGGGGGGGGEGPPPPRDPRDPPPDPPVVPLPAPGLLLFSALGAAALVRRKRG